VPSAGANDGELGRKLSKCFPPFLVVGVSFSVTQYFWSNHVDSNLVDIASAIVSIIVTIVFLRFWKPKRIWRFDYDKPEAPLPLRLFPARSRTTWRQVARQEYDGYVAPKKYPAGVVLKAWMPFAILPYSFCSGDCQR